MERSEWGLLHSAPYGGLYRGEREEVSKRDLMKTYSVILAVLLFTQTFFAQEQVPNDPAQQVMFDPLFDDPELNRFLNPDETEQEYVYSMEQPPPPGKLLIWLRIIGVPVINAFFAVRRAVKESFAWILVKLQLHKQEPKAHAQS